MRSKRAGDDAAAHVGLGPTMESGGPDSKQAGLPRPRSYDELAKEHSAKVAKDDVGPNGDALFRATHVLLLGSHEQGHPVMLQKSREGSSHPHVTPFTLCLEGRGPERDAAIYRALTSLQPSGFGAVDSAWFMVRRGPLVVLPFDAKDEAARPDLLY